MLVVAVQVIAGITPGVAAAALASPTPMDSCVSTLSTRGLYGRPKGKAARTHANSCFARPSAASRHTGLAPMSDRRLSVDRLDSCRWMHSDIPDGRLGRHNGVFDQPRALIQSTGAKLTEPDRSRSKSFCCGAGGGQFWKEEEKGTERVSANRYRELKQTGAKTVATGCPFCMRMITEETAKEEPEIAMEVMDVAEIVAKSLRK